MWYPFPQASTKPRPQMCSWHSIFPMTYKNEEPHTLGYYRSHGTVSKTGGFTLNVWQMPTQRVKFQLLKILQYIIDCSVICPKDCLACGGGQLSVDISFFQRWLHFGSAFTQPLYKNILACWSKRMLHKINYFWWSSGHFSVNKFISYKTYKIVNCEGCM